MKDFKLLWQEAKIYLKSEIDDFQYNRYIENLQVHSFDENSIILSTPAKFNVEIINGHLIFNIKNALNLIAGKTIDVSITYNNDANNEQMSITNYKNNFDQQSKLNPKYTFEEFVVGNSNQLVYAASKNVASNPSKNYNPLFIYGGVGLGKTHLMQAIGNYIKKENPDAIISYVTSEEFTNELITSIQNKSSNNQTSEAFRNRYRNVDVLLIDDIQFIAGKDSTQEEFFHTFNALHANNKQIVLSSDRPPKEMKTLEARLRSRFEGGLIADIQPPDYETRIAILRKKAETENLEVDDEVNAYIADNIRSNIRELEGALTKVKAYSLITGKAIDKNLAQLALKDIFKPQQAKQLNSDMIKTTVAEYYGIKISDMESTSRKKSIVIARHVSIYLCMDLLGLSTTKIGEIFNRDHSTIIHGNNKINEELKVNISLKQQIEEIKKKLSDNL